ncbi:MAG: MBL fold metallo-hydrolase [Nitrospirae bacterium]|nr:MBL fold metallo-hydrolase [Nitrospirota bacterium]
MKLVILGSGTCVPSLKRNAPGYLIEVEGLNLLVDCGSGTLLQLEKAGRSYRDIETVFITHCHPDHISDLMPLIHALIATPEYTRKKPLRIVGSSLVGEYLDGCIWGLLKRPDSFSVDFYRVEGKMEFHHLTLYSAKTLHSEDSFAFRFEHKGHSLVFTGDADYSESLVELCTGADLLVADCSYPHELKRKGHLTPRECGIVASQAGVKHLILSHLYPTKYSDKEILEECKREFNGRISIAEDLMEIDLI